MASNDPQGGSQGSGSGWLIGGGILAVALLAFIFQNRQTVRFHWLFWTFDAKLWLMLVITAVVAFVLGQFALMWRRHKRRQARRDSR